MTFLLATPLLIALFVLLVIFISVAVELENTKWANGLFSLGIGILIWHYRTEIWDWISSNPWDTVMFVGIYILGGLLWSLIKWKSYISKSARQFTEVRDNFIKEVGPIGSHWSDWINTLNRSKFTGIENTYENSFEFSNEPEDIVRKLTINPAEKRSIIISWISYFPMSVAATFLNDPIRRFFSWVYEKFSGVYRRMSKSSVKNIGEGMNKYDKKEQVK